MTDQPELPDPQQLRASDADRERVAQFLHAAMAEGRLTMAELDERLQSVYAAKTHGELVPITGDLPGGQLAVPQPKVPAVADPATNLPQRVGGTPTSSTAIAVMSGADRRGRWVVPKTFNAFALMGGVQIDLTEAMLSEPEVTIQATAVMGAVEIIVPEDITVRVNGFGFMGAYEDNTSAQAPEGSPIVRFTGLALMGGVEVRHMTKKEKRKKQKELDE
ncbi:cell wall-active antibiotic response 4TMS protein YvqF [Tamaricihabitans halophyticus]|uniref:Cell wall-active antibiotic response 4TMS protein YvqF n=1 Tax=Tamaricihabitans halophyticus TaxID=1262583 RepID=A0A4R2QJ63_9PSEU|nr:DUF1707 domain-containing protein [Tamaricihabitans halophyticus]TCP49307.1 cell wall-active antibiotic response 4TMS protein YvqF [Tamaricihabitans halophyticus]